MCTPFSLPSSGAHATLNGTPRIPSVTCSQARECSSSGKATLLITCLTSCCFAVPRFRGRAPRALTRGDSTAARCSFTRWRFSFPLDAALCSAASASCASARGVCVAPGTSFGQPTEKVSTFLPRFLCFVRQGLACRDTLVAQALVFDSELGRSTPRFNLPPCAVGTHPKPTNLPSASVQYRDMQPWENLLVALLSGSELGNVAGQATEVGTFGSVGSEQRRQHKAACTLVPTPVACPATLPNVWNYRLETAPAAQSRLYPRSYFFRLSRYITQL